MDHAQTEADDFFSWSASIDGDLVLPSKGQQICLIRKILAALQVGQQLPALHVTRIARRRRKDTDRFALALPLLLSIEDPQVPKE